MVAMAGDSPKATPRVLLRQRIDLADPKIAGSSQLYHTAAQLSIEKATLFVQKCITATGEMAKRAVAAAMAEVSTMGYPVGGACVLGGSGRPSGDLASILASHPLIHTAEGEFYREALKTACKACGLIAALIPERELLRRAASVLQLPAEDVEKQISQMGKGIGPPWRKDEKLAALAGWMGLCQAGEY
jgi:hypothetical protein